MKVQLNKKNVTWVTPDHFVDCDFDPAVLAGILKKVNINWIVLLPAKNARFAETDFTALQGLNGLTIQFVYWTHRARNPKMLLYYNRVYNLIQRSEPDLVYFNYVPTSPYILPLYWRLNKNKTIVTAHDGNVKPSFDKPGIAKAIFKLAFGTVKHVNMFSLSEAALFTSDHPKAKVSIMPLGLKNFGTPVSAKTNNDVVFLFFGSIHGNKDVGLLIDAACNMYEKGLRGFKVAIHGACANWDDYAVKITYPEIFAVDIRLHANNEIPELFTQSDYAMFPYKQMSQSGALKVAFNYNVPVITSDLPAFKDEVHEGVNGYLFKAGEVKDLERVMSERLFYHQDAYQTLVKNMRQHNEKTYSAKVLADKYLNLFDAVLQNN